VFSQFHHGHSVTYRIALRLASGCQKARSQTPARRINITTADRPFGMPDE
jgi:hypothetical protein